MRTDDTSRKHASSAPRGRLADFLFIGLGVVPVVLLLGGTPGIALLLFIPLLFAACLCGMWEQVEFPADRGASAGNSQEPQNGDLPAAGVSLRKKL